MSEAPHTTPSVHRHWVGAVVLLSILCILGIAGQSAAALAEVLARDGMLAAVWAMACIGIGAWIVPSRLTPGDDDSRALRLATTFAAGAGVLSLVVLALGLAGTLNPPVAWGLVLAGVAAVGAAIWRRRNTGAAVGMSVSSWSWAWLIAVPAIAVLVIAPAVLPGVLWGDEPNGYDVVSYHLEVPREWHDGGRISRLDHNVFSTFPFLTEMHFLLAMHLRGGAYAGMYLAQYMHAVFAVFTAIAVYGVLGGRAKPHAVVGGIITLAVPWTSMVGTVAYNEAALMLYAVLCAAWLWRAAQPLELGMAHVRLGGIGAAAVSGAMGGFASGVKLTAVPMVVLASVVAAAIVRPRAWRTILLMLLTAAVVASPWFIRNLVWTGNPVFPQATAQLGGRDWSPEQQERWSAAHAPREDQRSITARFAAFRDQVLIDWKYGFVLIPMAAVAAATSLVRLRRDERGVVAFVCLVVVGQALVWMFATHLQGRFFVLAIPLLAMLVGSRGFPTGAGLVAAVVCAMSGVISFAEPSIDGDDPNRLMAQPVPRLIDPRMRACVGITDPNAFWAFVPEVVAAAAQQGDRPIALVGEARAFWWPVDSRRLHYRTVFDVDREDGDSLIDAWKRGAPAESMVVVDPNELRRFVRTYRGLGELPAEIAERGETFLRE